MGIIIHTNRKGRSSHAFLKKAWHWSVTLTYLPQSACESRTSQVLFLIHPFSLWCSQKHDVRQQPEGMPPSDTTSLLSEKGDTPAQFPMFHNKLFKSNKQAKSCHCLQLTVSGFATWKQTAFCSLSCFSLVALGVGRDQSPSNVRHSHPQLSQGSRDTEGNAYLQETQSLRECVNKSN